ncbi:MAG: hypothetical protein J6T13_10670 [Bacteroidales bacterium]|nr:hypothetical protein [Bacteroidales bacterium]
MKRYFFISILTLIVVFDSFAQIRIDCNTEELYENIQGVWRQTEGNALAIVDSNAYFLYGTDQGVWQDTYEELFSIMKNDNGESFFIWWSDLVVQEFVLEKDTLLLLDRKGRSETYIRVNDALNEKYFPEKSQLESQTKSDQ